MKPYKLYLCHWRWVPEVAALVAAPTRGQAKATLYRHVCANFWPSAEYVDVYAQRSELADERAYHAGWRMPHLASPAAGGKGQWQ